MGAYDHSTNKETLINTNCKLGPVFAITGNTNQTHTYCTQSTCRHGFILTIDHVYDSCVLQVRDGSSSSSPLLGTFCGIEIPPMLQSTQKSLYIRFKTDSSGTNFGFEAAYGSFLEGEK